MTPNSPTPLAPEADLGFGRVVLQQSRGRFLTRDGRMNARKFGLGSQRAEKLYLQALNESWLTFIAWLVGVVLFIPGWALARREP